MNQYFLVFCILVSASAALEENLKLITTESRLPSPLTGHSAVYDGDNSIYILGGDGNSGYNQRIFKYSLLDGTVDDDGTFINVVSGAAVMHGDDIFFFGGASETPYVSSVHRYSTKARNVTEVGKFPTPALYLVSAEWDTRREVAYVFGGALTEAPFASDVIYRYNPTNDQVDMVASLPAPTYATASVWDDVRSVAYIFGGLSSSQILVFDPTTNGVSKLNATLPNSIQTPAAAFVELNQKAYISDYSGPSLIEFDSFSLTARNVQVDSWVPISRTASVYIQKLNRIYFLGGQYRTPDDGYIHYIDRISYIDFRGETSPTTTTSTTTTEGPTPEDPCKGGVTALIPDPFCCESFYFCLGGVGTKYQCPAGEHFNSRTSQCQDAGEVRCRITEN